MKRALLLLGVALLAGLAIALLMVASAGLPPVGNLAQHVPTRTSFMKAREKEASREGRRYHVDQRWVPYQRISLLLRHAVLIAEDDAFYSHDGLDWDQMQAAARENMEKKRVVRGGSTITQQLAKNLYLGEERTIIRKLKEIILAVRLERALTKHRIFELYLNLIEWGDGIFGAEAASQRYFGVPASELSPRQAALLAAVIINPRKFSATAPDRRIERRVQMILGRMVRRGWISQDQYLVALGRQPEHHGFFDWLFGPSKEAAPVPTPSPVEESAPAESISQQPAPADTLP
jgi:monofunctional biosynthetic peptidoglycan transglycosylase